MMKVPSLRYLLNRIAQTTAALTRLKPVWNDRSTSLSSKIRLMRSLVTSIFLYACESWVLTAELQRKIQTMELRCYRKILGISYKDHVTNEDVCAKVQQAIVPHEDLLTTVKRRKLQRFGHVYCSSGLASTILQGTVKRGRWQGRQRKRWEDNIREWTVLEFVKSQRAVENWEKWMKLVAKLSVVPKRPWRLRNRWWRRYWLCRNSPKMAIKVMGHDMSRIFGSSRQNCTQRTYCIPADDKPLLHLEGPRNHRRQCPTVRSPRLPPFLPWSGTHSPGEWSRDQQKYLHMIIIIIRRSTANDQTTHIQVQKCRHLVSYVSETHQSHKAYCARYFRWV